MVVIYYFEIPLMVSNILCTCSCRTLKCTRERQIVHSGCFQLYKPDSIIVTWRNAITDLVESNYEDRSDVKNLYHKLFWKPIYDVFIGYGINFPISQVLLGELKTFLDSCNLVGRYPDGNFFCPIRVCELNNIEIAKFPPKKKKKVAGSSSGGRGGGRGGRGSGRGGRGGGRGRGRGRGSSKSSESTRKSSSGTTSGKKRKSAPSSQSSSGTTSGKKRKSTPSPHGVLSLVSKNKRATTSPSNKKRTTETSALKKKPSSKKSLKKTSDDPAKQWQVDGVIITSLDV